MTLHEIWRRLMTSRYTRALEVGVERRDLELARERAEIRRLRAENRALLNSILGIAGIPPVIAGEEEWMAASQESHSMQPPFVAQSPAAPQSAEAAQAVLPKRESAREWAGKQRGANARLATPLRKRSWQQINRALEFASAQKKQSEITTPPWPPATRS